MLEFSKNLYFSDCGEVDPIGRIFGFDFLIATMRHLQEKYNRSFIRFINDPLKTDGEDVVVWKEQNSVTSAGTCVAIKGMKASFLN